jgi:hypothetical protein
MIEHSGDFSDHFPPTVAGIRHAVLLWKPVVKQVSVSDYDGGMPISICHDAQVEEGPSNTCKVYITALVLPEMAAELEEALGWTTAEIEGRLSAYLDYYRPLTVAFKVQVLIHPAVGEGGPYR